MSIIKANGAGDQSTGFYNGVATQSLRFDDGSSAYLSRTPLSAGDRREYTLSFWVKRANIGIADCALFGVQTDGSNRVYIRWEADDTFKVYFAIGGSAYDNGTTMVFRDTSSWYHIVIAVDMDGSTNTDKLKIYVNGTNQTVTYNATLPTSDTAMNSTSLHTLGKKDGASNFLDGYLSEVNFIDGTAIGDSDTDGYLDEFGELKNGVWIPKAYTGSYGTNGYRLQFNQTGTGTGSSSTVGADSANSNHFDSSGIDTEDCDIPDSPENNFCTYNPLDPKGNDNTFSEGNLKVVVNAQNTDEQTTTTFAVSSGKWYWEHRLNSTTTTAGYFKIGLRGTDADGSAWTVRGTDGETQDSSGTTGSSSVSYTTGNVIGVYLDMDNGKWYVSVDGVLQNSANLTSGTGFLHSNLTGELRPFILNASSGGTHTGQGNFGQDSTFAGEESAGGNADENGNGDFHSSVFSGYLALCSANLPEPTISPNADTQADNYFGILTYTGNGTGSGSTNNIRSGDPGVGGEIDFKPDWTWIKSKSNDTNHILTDSVRLAGNVLFSNLPNTEADNTAFFTSFETNGFDLAQNGGDTNASGYTYVAWNWKAGGTAVTNTQGDIQSQVSANTDAGFSVVTYTGSVSGSPSTIGHGLGKTPRMIIVKPRSASGNWAVYHEDLNPSSSYNHAIFLNLTNQKSSATNAYWGGNTMTLNNNLFSVNNSTETNTNGVTYVAYCFAEIEGFSKFGVYSSNSSPDGPMIFTGFRPKFVLIKKTDGSASWWIVDAVRDTYNPTDSYLLPDSNKLDRTYTTADFLSNGFKIRNTSTAFNSGTHIYMAFAETPFKYANAR